MPRQSNGRALRLITVNGPLWLWSGEGGNWHFITVPEDQSGELRAESLASRRGFGSVKVEVTANGVTWRTSVFPLKSGDYILPVKAKVRRDAGISAGDTVTVSIELFVRIG